VILLLHDYFPKHLGKRKFTGSFRLSASLKRDAEDYILNDGFAFARQILIQPFDYFASPIAVEDFSASADCVIPP